MARPTEAHWRQPLLAAALGLLSVLAFEPIGAFPLIVATLAGLFRLLDKTADARCAKTGAKIGFAFGAGLFIGGVSWIYVSLSTFGGMPAPVAGLATLLFCLFLALYPALVGAIFSRCAPAAGWRRPLFFAALWALSEWLRGYVLTGFPWLAVGYTQTPPSPLAGIAPILGVFGISAVTAWLGAALAVAYASWRSRGATATLRGPLLAIVLVLISTGLLRNIRWTEARGEPLSVALLQGNIPQELKWRPEWFNESLRTYFRLAEDNPAQLTVLPETAIPALYEQLPPGFIDALRGLALRENGELILGVATGSAQVYANSAIAVGAAGLQRYDKSHLVPFGEFVPPGFRWLMDLAQIPMSDFTPGAAQQPPIRIGPLKAALDICYEDAFGEEIIRALPEAELLINLSNVAWFGDSLAPAQHLQISRMRTLETGRMMLRATNTGMTAIIAADGRVVAKLPPFTRAALRGEIRAYVGVTPFVRGGNAPIVLLCLLCAALLWRRNTVS